MMGLTVHPALFWIRSVGKINKYQKQSDEAQAAAKRWRDCERKKAFATEAEAFQKGQRSYRCPHCNMWHRSGILFKLANKLARSSDRKKQR